MHHTGNRWYSDVTSHQTTPGGPCISYRPYAGPNGIVCVLQVDILKKTAGEEWKGIEEKLNSGEIPRARIPTEEEKQKLNGMNISELPAELADIVSKALS